MMKPTVVVLVFVTATVACAGRVTQTQTSPRLQNGAVSPQPAARPDPRSGSRTAAFQQDATRDDAPGVVKPVAVRPVRPTYTAEAMQAKIQGSVDVQIVVAPDGSVARQRIVKVTWTGDSYDGNQFTDLTPGLIANALAAAQAAKFRPGTRDGSPVPVLTTITLMFEFH
jgi:outer membrane biosynthesis protein TonB